MSSNKHWEVIKFMDENFLLIIEPNVICENGAIYRVNSEVYEFAQNQGVTLQSILDRFDIHNSFEKISTTERVNPDMNQRKNTSTKFYGKGFIATIEGDRYYLEYQFDRGVGGRKFEISREIYLDALSNKFSTSELFRKYNLYHLDVPENDV